MLKQVLLFAFAISISTCILAQTSGWETGIALSGGCSMNLVTGISPMGEPFAGNIKANNGPSWSYSAGVYGRKFFKDRYGIEVGLQYTSFGLLNKGTVTLVTPDGQPDPVLGNVTKPVTIKMNYRHNYVELPVRFVFKKDIGTRFSIGCFAGVAPAVLTHAYARNVLVQREENFRQVGKDGSYTGHSTRFNLFADVGLLLRANITQQFSLDFRPYFRATVLPTYTKNTSPNFEERFMSAGLTVASVWKF